MKAWELVLYFLALVLSGCFIYSIAWGRGFYAGYEAGEEFGLKTGKERARKSAAIGRTE